MDYFLVFGLGLLIGAYLFHKPLRDWINTKLRRKQSVSDKAEETTDKPKAKKQTKKKSTTDSKGTTKLS